MRHVASTCKLSVKTIALLHDGGLAPDIAEAPPLGITLTRRLAAT